jgi:hypothetical protein
MASLDAKVARGKRGGEGGGQTNHLRKHQETSSIQTDFFTPFLGNEIQVNLGFLCDNVDCLLFFVESWLLAQCRQLVRAYHRLPRNLTNCTPRFFSGENFIELSYLQYVPYLKGQTTRSSAVFAAEKRGEVDEGSGDWASTLNVCSKEETDPAVMLLRERREEGK